MAIEMSNEIPPASPEQPGSPVPSIIAQRAKSKVQNWLNFKCPDVDPNLSFEASSVKSFRAKLCPNSTLQLKERSFESVVLDDDVVNFLPIKQEGSKIPPPNIEKLKILVDENSSFLFTLSSLVNPGKFYIQPVQEQPDSLNKIHQEIERHSHTLSTPDQSLVVPGTVWCLFNQVKQKWCRVRVERCSSSCVSVRSIDDGTSQQSIGFGSLRRLPKLNPNSWVSQRPGLAVLCHLVGCSPTGRVWDPKSTAKLEKILGYSKQHRAIAVVEENGSMGLVLLAKENLMNQKMVEWGFAVQRRT